MDKSLLVASGIFVFDQLSKLYVVEKLDLKTVGVIEVFPPYLNFHMAWNTGINFGLFADNSDVVRWGLTAFSIIISMVLWRWAARIESVRMEIFIGLIIGGALGNGIDRVVYGAVADFLNMSCCGFNNPYAFNVADIAIFVGAVGLILFSNNPKNSG